ncbi:recombination regulator RecX [Rossellomorea sp. BNER]|uniref:recombination regulator RecX n=1 Tax=Rossellomorea sp. BNER TaxID=2962031 RepID=UPI003AF22DAD|nr:recombination regulator RecX [Rossellomorea sp. BNER]
MKTVTKITKQVKNDERYNIFIDNQYAFSVDEEVLARYGLLKGKEIDDLLLAEIQYEDDIRKGFQSAIHYLSFRMRTEKEVREYLIKKEVEETLVQEVIHKLHQYGYLNDEDFAQSFLNTYIRTSDKGPDWIKTELMNKGVHQDIIEKVLKSYPEDLQLERAIDLTEKLVKKYKKESSIQAKQKVEISLIRKGYRTSIIRIAWDEASTEKDSNEEWEALYKQALKAHQRISKKATGFEYKQKMKQTLYRKGFPLESIDKVLDEINEE